MSLTIFICFVAIAAHHSFICVHRAANVFNQWVSKVFKKHIFWYKFVACIQAHMNWEYQCGCSHCNLVSHTRKSLISETGANLSRAFSIYFTREWRILCRRLKANTIESEGNLKSCSRICVYNHQIDRIPSAVQIDRRRAIIISTSHLIRERTLKEETIGGAIIIFIIISTGEITSTTFQRNVYGPEHVPRQNIFIYFVCFFFLSLLFSCPMPLSWEICGKMPLSLQIRVELRVYMATQ